MDGPFGMFPSNGRMALQVMQRVAVVMLSLLRQLVLTCIPSSCFCSLPGEALAVPLTPGVAAGTWWPWLHVVLNRCASLGCSGPLLHQAGVAAQVWLTLGPQSWSQGSVGHT